MEWVREFYAQTGAWWAAADAKVSERDQERVRLLRENGGATARRVLELGAGYGATSVATARAGYAVTAVEISDRVDHADHLAHDLGPGTLTVHKEDFYAVELAGRFDAVMYWNGFGIGTDSDQRLLLRRIANLWLAPGGVALIDVFNPFVWAKWDGDEEHLLPDPEAGYAYELREQTRFDPLTCTATDTWWQVAQPDQKISQTLRCYAPADLALLLGGTGLELVDLVIGGQSVGLPGTPPAGPAAAPVAGPVAEPAASPDPSATMQELLHHHHEYLAVLRHAPAPHPG
ncbi:class I SAM-dependent methyltransferase [Streptomyces zagrosensis]|uniref:SAM-dependent methyltransferase n=1 Tax=Streptomyces zagrosensis TaxID=1042984 RepID=A0A7W9Q9T8_9ACTN|nr:class I SAM-dependent methyltransferase [Streptomyces zagrosensis]MBB5935818.1 SAM-dependent methyltransferase [Streptomyces zagrosensis]